MSLEIRPFASNTILIKGNIDTAFDDEKDLLTLHCSECQQELKVEYSFIRGLAGKLLARSRKKKKEEL